MTSDRFALMGAKPLFAFLRGGVAEIVVHGLVYFKRGADPIDLNESPSADPGSLIITRSLLKPWQFLAADVAGSEPFWALGFASHSGEGSHLQALSRLAEQVEAAEEDLFCPRSYPLDWAESARLKLAGEKPSRLHHPCSGKHLVMMASCKKFGDPLANYWHEDHAAQKRVQALVGSQIKAKPQWIQDGCGLPTLGLSAGAHIDMWQKLVTSDDHASQNLIQLWTENVRLVGGSRRLSSELMEAIPGRIIAKEGADGALVVQSLPAAGQEVATCLIKLASGYQTSYLALALWSLLSRTQGLPYPFVDLAEYLRSRLESWVPQDQQLKLPPFDPSSARDHLNLTT